MFHQLSLLDTSKTSWRIKVRVTRMWPSVSNSSNSSESIKGYNLILLDDDDCHVQAFVYADNWKSLADKFVEGGVYIISNFYTKEAKGSLKPVSSNILINFSASTNVEKVEEDDFMIPKHKFEFLDLSDLFSVASSYGDVEKPDYSTDVIGVLEDFESITKIKTKFGERNIVKFRLTDGRHSHKVTVWGALAVSADAMYKEIVEKPIIVIVTSTKLTTFRTSVQIATLPSSKLYLNLDTDAVIAMRKRLDEEGYIPAEKSVSSHTQTELTVSSPVNETVTLKELSERTSTEYLKSNFLCKVKVKQVEKNDIWWYNSCNKNDCHEELSKFEGKYRCLKCKRNYPVPQKRYKIVVLAEDETEAFNFVLLDRAAKRLIGKTATKLIAETLEDEQSKEYPPQILQICGKEITLKIELNDDNIVEKSTVYEATDAYQSTATSSSNTATTVQDLSHSEYGDNIAVRLDVSGNTPCSAKSTTKKIKTEK